MKDAQTRINTLSRQPLFQHFNFLPILEKKIKKIIKKNYKKVERLKENLRKHHKYGISSSFKKFQELISEIFLKDLQRHNILTKNI